jgi:uncharacterized protein (DUF362 family)
MASGSIDGQEVIYIELEGLNKSTLDDAHVAVVETADCYIGSSVETLLGKAIRDCGEMLGWNSTDRGAFGGIIEPGARVVIKPNFVTHANRGTGGLLPLVTHPAVVRSVVDEVLKSHASEVIVGDAPIQSCDFEELLRVTGLSDWEDDLLKREPRFKGIRDFRRTISKVENGSRVARIDVQPEDEYVRFDLGTESLLEPVSGKKNKFRVTSYDPRQMAKTHSPGTHQYLIAKYVLDADVIINLPKLKTHKKAGITCALKNLVGINGNKEFLPHHRVGGSDSGGDCYPGKSFTKRILEIALDRMNMTTSKRGQKMYGEIANQLDRANRLGGDQLGVEGSWIGNQTVPRMTLDLNRILLYGTVQGVMSERIQRRVVSIVDGIIAGQGDGPLSPSELPLGIIMAGSNSAAIDWIAAQFLRLVPEKVPLLKLAFEKFRWPITRFGSNDIKPVTQAGRTIEDLLFSVDRVVEVPHGWQSALDVSE